MLHNDTPYAVRGEERRRGLRSAGSSYSPARWPIILSLSTEFSSDRTTVAVGSGIPLPSDGGVVRCLPTGTVNILLYDTLRFWLAARSPVML